MEDSELFKMSGASAGTIAVILLLYKLLKGAVGKKLISNCCGRKIEVGLDIQATTPKEDIALEIKNPLHIDGPTRNQEEQKHPS